MDPPRIPLNTMKNTSVNVNGTNTTKPVKPFFTTTTTSDLKPSPSQTTLLPSQPPQSTSTNNKLKKLLKEEDMPAFCNAVQDSNLSKLGLIEVLKKQFPGRSGAVIKATLEAVARREGVKEVDKRWRIVQ
jgi:chromatin assembly factor 1 subunit A